MYPKKYLLPSEKSREKQTKNPVGHPNSLGEKTSTEGKAGYISLDHLLVSETSG